MSKHDLRARPVFHHTREATWAHLTTVMASLAVARYLQETTGISIPRIVREPKRPTGSHHQSQRPPDHRPALTHPKPQPASSNPYSSQGTKVS